MHIPEELTNCRSNQMYADIIAASRQSLPVLRRERHVLYQQVQEAKAARPQAERPLSDALLEQALLGVTPTLIEEGDLMTLKAMADAGQERVDDAQQQLQAKRTAIRGVYEQIRYTRGRMDQHEAAIHYPYSPYKENDELQPLPKRMAFAAVRAGMVLRKAVSRSTK